MITDGLYPAKCVGGDVNGVPRPLSAEATIPADEFVEVRMVFGAEEDERFDWTRFEASPRCAHSRRTSARP